MKARVTIVALIVISMISFANLSHAAGLNMVLGQTFNINTSVLNVEGDVTNVGTLQTSTGSINLNGNWTNTGTFNAGTSGTVAFTGSSVSTITGANTFANFTCTQAGKQLSFEAGKTQTIGGTWTLTGSSGNLIKLRSTVAGTQWKVDPTGTKNISFVDVKDSNNINSAIINPTNSTDSGNNTNWFSTSATPTPTPTPSTGDTTAPTVTITSPTSSSTYTTTSSTITLSGTASDNSGSVSSVTWSNSKGGSGTASGTTSWSISSISLSSGDNIITVTATDGSGNSGTDTITVTYNATTTQPPTVTTDSATNVTSSTSTLNGTVNANGVSTTAWFELGISSGTYGGKTSTQGVGGTGNTTVSMNISGLSPGTGYYYRIAAQNSAGTSYGSENNFTTSSVSTTPTPTPVQTSAPTPTPTPTATKTPTPTATPTPTPGEGDGVIYGGVSDEEGNPLEGVTVMITGTDYKNSKETESDGFYEFSGLKGGEYTLTYKKSGYKERTESVSLGEGDTVNLGTIALEITVKGSIEGYVVNINGDPIESVKVQLKKIKPRSTKTVFSEQDGSFEFEDLEAGVYRVIARKRSYRKFSERITLNEGEEKEMEIVLRKASK